jgi:protein SCO1
MKLCVPTRGMLRLLLVFYVSVAFCQTQRQPASGLVLKVDPAHQTAVISCKEIPGYMGAMEMSLRLSSATEFNKLKPGDMIDFVLVADKNDAYADSVRVHAYQGFEPDPSSARRLKLLAKAAQPSGKPLAIGDTVPDFTLTGQDGKPVAFSQFRGKVVVLDFVYTRCALPNFCIRSSNNFGELQKRFRNQLPRDLILATVTFDPVHDSPEALAKYSQRWNADPAAWRFLTGSEAAIRRVCDLFGEDYFPDEGLMDHSLHTAIIDRSGHLVANLEGNEFTAEQLGDLVQTVLAQRPAPSR